MGISLDRIVNVQITRSTRTASRRSFGMALIAAFHRAWPDRARLYADADEMLEDGFKAHHPAYLAALSLKSQDPAPRAFKVGRRLGAPAQLLRFELRDPIEGERYALRIAGVPFEVIAGATDTRTSIAAALAGRINPDPDAILASAASATLAQELDESDFDGVIGASEINPPRNLVVMLSAHADWRASTIIVTGLDANGRTIVESFEVPAGGNVARVGEKLLAAVVGISIPAQGGSGGALLVGVGKAFASQHLSVTARAIGAAVEIAADEDGDWYAASEATRNMSIEDRTAEPSAPPLAEDLAGIRAEDADFYALVVADAQSEAQIAAVSTWAETQPIVYVPHTIDSAVEANTLDDVVGALREAERLRTAPVYNRRSHGRFPDAALLGRLLPHLPGTVNPAFKTLVGVLPDDLSETVVERLIGPPQSPSSGKRATIYVEVLPRGTNRGSAVTLGGLSSGDEWLDVIMGIDFLHSRLQEVPFNMLLAEPRVPFTQEGIDAFEGSVRAVLFEHASPPISFLDPSSIRTEAVALEDTSAADRKARHYDGVRWSARVTGAMNSLRIGGTVSP